MKPFLKKQILLLRVNSLVTLLIISTTAAFADVSCEDQDNKAECEEEVSKMRIRRAQVQNKNNVEKINDDSRINGKDVPESESKHDKRALKAKPQ